MNQSQAVPFKFVVQISINPESRNICAFIAPRTGVSYNQIFILTAALSSSVSSADSCLTPYACSPTPKALIARIALHTFYLQTVAVYTLTHLPFLSSRQLRIDP